MSKKLLWLALALTFVGLFTFVYGDTTYDTEPIPIETRDWPEAVRTEEVPPEAMYNEDDIELAVLPTDAPTDEPTVVSQKLAIGDTYPINFKPSTKMRRDFSAREMLDQYRDWLLLAVVSNLGLPEDEVNQILFDLPTTRYNYMQVIAQFEYGITRTAMLPDGSIVALVPEDASENERIDHVAGMADYHRKNTGQRPTLAHIYEYSVDHESDSGTLKYVGEESLEPYFTEAYGYVEMAIASSEDLEEFLDKTDTLVFITKGSSFGSPILGGRDYLSKAYRGIDIEDVAALYHSQTVINQTQQHWDDEFSAFIDAANSSLRLIRTTFATNIDLIAQQARIAAEARAAQLLANYPIDCGSREAALSFAGASSIRTWETQLVEGYTWYFCAFNRAQLAGEIDYASGFSLDPAYDYDEVYQFYEDNLDLFYRIADDVQELAASPPREMDEEHIQSVNLLYFIFDEDLTRSLVNETLRNINNLIITQEQIDAVGRAIRANDANPLLNLVGDIVDVQLVLDTDMFFEVETLQSAVQDLDFQAARYDGDLEGTEVGMVLFYTDLLAKLWAIDFVNTSPSCDDPTRLLREKADDACFVDFNSLPNRQIANIYREELNQLSSTRLWFGTRDDGYQEADNNLLFSHTSTRVYAASSNTLRPGVESDPNALSAEFLGWWNDHYAEIAFYEPEYQRLNEIMKWSTVFTWLYTGVDDDGNTLWRSPHDERNFAFLADVDFVDDHRFPRWAKENMDQLTFKQWGEIEFYPDDYAGIKTESLPRLWGIESQYDGRTWGGGVSLADPTDLIRPSRLTSAADDLPVFWLRSTTNYLDGTAPNVIRTLDNIDYGFNFADDIAHLDINVPGGTKLRGATDELSSLGGAGADAPNFTRTVQQVDEWTGVRQTYNGVDIGQVDININRSSGNTNSFDIGFTSLDIDAGQQLAYDMSVSSNPRNVIMNADFVQTGIDLGDGSYAVRMQGSDEWMQVAPGSPSVEVPRGWDARASGLDVGAQDYVMRWNDNPFLSNDDILVFRNNDTLLSTVDELPPALNQRTINNGDDSFRVFTNDDGDVFVNYGDLPPTFRDNPDLIQPLLRNEDIPTVHGMPRDNPLYDVVMANDRDAFTQRLITDPEVTMQQYDGLIGDTLQSLEAGILDGDIAAVRPTLDKLKNFNPDDPRIQLYDVIFDWQSGNAARASDTINNMGPVPGIDEVTVNFLSEAATRGSSQARNSANTVKKMMWDVLDERGLTTSDNLIIDFGDESSHLLGTRLGDGDEVTRIPPDADVYVAVDNTAGSNTGNTMTQFFEGDTVTRNRMIADGDVRVTRHTNDDIGNFRPDSFEDTTGRNYERASSGSSTNQSGQTLEESLPENLNTAVQNAGNVPECLTDSEDDDFCGVNFGQSQDVYIVEPQQ